MTIDLSNAKVGDKVKHRNGGVSVLRRIDKDPCERVWIDNFIFNFNGRYDHRQETQFDIVELIPAKDELEKAVKELADFFIIKNVMLSYVSMKELQEKLLNFAKAIKASKS